MEKSDTKIPNARWFAIRDLPFALGRDPHEVEIDVVAKAIIEFTKLHVEAALKAACEFADGDDIEENRDQILKAYPPENIK